MKLGAQLYSVRDNVQNAQDFRTTLKKLKAMGYENVQASGIGPIAPEDLRDISAELEGFHLTFPWLFHMSLLLTGP